MLSKDLLDLPSPFGIESKDGKESGITGQLHLSAGRFNIIEHDEMGLPILGAVGKDRQHSSRA